MITRRTFIKLVSVVLASIPMGKRIQKQDKVSRVSMPVSQDIIHFSGVSRYKVPDGYCILIESVSAHNSNDESSNVRLFYGDRVLFEGLLYPYSGNQFKLIAPIKVDGGEEAVIISEQGVDGVFEGYAYAA